MTGNRRTTFWLDHDGPAGVDTLDGLCRVEGRKRGDMIRRLIAEAVTARGWHSNWPLTAAPPAPGQTTIDDEATA